MKNKEKIKFRSQQLIMFWYWINERHRVYLAKREGKPFPWTKDRIISEYKFTNAFRQLDRVTMEWTNRYLKLPKKLSYGDVIFQCCLFRLFNWPQTYDTLMFGMSKWDRKKAVALIDNMKKEGKQIFTGAYIIPSAGRTDPKHWMICEVLDQIHKERGEIADAIRKAGTMEAATKILQQYHSVGPFIAYEIACDLRHTKVLADAKDTCSWANPGPGAQRGIHRLITGNKNWKGPRPDYQQAMRMLLEMAPKRLHKHVKACEWPFESREIEHSLCEFDKYMRVKMKQGKPRSKYVYKAQMELF